MFAKLKKKIQEEGGISGTEPGDKQMPPSGGDVGSAVKTSNLSYIHNADYQAHKRTSSSSVEPENQSREKEFEKPVLVNPAESVETGSKEELAELLLRRTQQVKTFEVKLTELTSIVKEKNLHIEKLETELERQQDLLCQRLQDLNEQYHSSRAKLSENITVAVKKREEELRLEMQDLEKAKLRLEERLTVLELERDRFVRKAEERETVEKAANEEHAKLKNLLLQSEMEIDRYKKILSEKSSDQIDKKELLDQVALLTRQKNEAERKSQAQEDLVLSLRSTNERLEKQLKDSKDAYAQLAVQNSQDEWLEKQIESERVITTLEEEVSNIKLELSQKERDRTILSKQLSDRDKEIVDAKAQIEKFQLELQQTRMRIDQLERESEDSRRRLDDASRDKVALCQQFDEQSQESISLQQSLCESKAELESTTKEKVQLISALEQQLAQCRTSLEAAQQKLSEIEESKSKERQMLENEEIARLKEELTDIQASLQEKNKIIKKQELRLADLKKLLQRELKVMPPNCDQNPLPSNGMSFQNSGDPVFPGYASSDLSDVGLSTGSISSSSAAMLPITHSLTLSDLRHAKQTLANNEGFVPALGTGVRRVEDGGGTLGQRFNPQGLRDAGEAEYDFTRELNFKYLRHVVLKFMLSRETEAVQLIKAVSMLLNFTTEEQKLIKDTLEWKMSWFGSRPHLPMKGQTAKVIPPSF